MPVYDYECKSCGNIEERIESIDKSFISCSVCGNKSRRIISTSSVNVANDDALWIRSILEVVDKDSKEPHVIEFRKNPTRYNYRKWMKGEGLRNIEPGEKRSQPDDNGRLDAITKYMVEKRIERNRIIINE